MQHEEVMFSKKKNYDNYMGKVRDEIADPEVRFSALFVVQAWKSLACRDRTGYVTGPNLWCCQQQSVCLYPGHHTCALFSFSITQPLDHNCLLNSWESGEFCSTSRAPSGWYPCPSSLRTVKGVTCFSPRSRWQWWQMMWVHSPNQFSVALRLKWPSMALPCYTISHKTNCFKSPPIANGHWVATTMCLLL